MKIKPLNEFLETHGFFRGLPSEDLMLLAGCGYPAPFHAGALLAREGDPADLFFVIRDGTVALEINDPRRGPLLIDTAGAGEVVGYSWIFPPYRWQVDVRATTAVRAIALDGSCLRGKCEQDPRLGYELTKRCAGLLQQRLDSARLRLVDVYGARAG